MTPETRAARDELARFLAERSSTLTDTIACSGAARDAARLTASGLSAVLAALDQHQVIAEAGREEWAAGRGCEDCSCCTAEGCRNGADGPIGQRCPSNSLGESICPCTGD